ncbi:MAG: hypothetical protein WB117_08705 [Candidatus Acidiferrales bacterium]|jgi:hypothetical protein
MRIREVIDENRDKAALAALKKHNEKDGWPLAPKVLARLEAKGYTTPEGTLTDKGNALLERA